MDTFGVRGFRSGFSPLCGPLKAAIGPRQCPSRAASEVDIFGLSGPLFEILKLWMSLTLSRITIRIAETPLGSGHARVHLSIL